MRNQMNSNGRREMVPGTILAQLYKSLAVLVPGTILRLDAGGDVALDSLPVSE